jgi:hypothetical protein
MGATSSGLIAEIFLQHMEHLHLAHLTHRQGITNYWRYIDDILSAFDPQPHKHTGNRSRLQCYTP